MNELDFAYSVAYIRAVENKLLSKSDIDNLVAAKNFDDAIRILVDKGYCGDVSDPYDFEKVLSYQTEKAWNEVKGAAPEGASLEILIYKNDFHNLKVALKGVNSGVKDYGEYVLTPSLIDFNKVVSAVLNGDFSALPEGFSQAIAEAYDVLSRTSDSQLADIIIDRAEMDFTYKKAVESKSEFLIGYVKLINTILNIKIAVRCAKTEKNIDFMERAISECSYISKNKIIKTALSGIDSLIQEISDEGFSKCAEALKTSITEYEKYSDVLVSDYMKDAAYLTFGIEPLIAYINKKRNEVQSVRIILSGKLGGFSPDEIRSRLRNYF